MVRGGSSQRRVILFLLFVLAVGPALIWRARVTNKRKEDSSMADDLKTTEVTSELR
jgi:hypothetical protein